MYIVLLSLVHFKLGLGVFCARAWPAVPFGRYWSFPSCAIDRSVGRALGLVADDRGGDVTRLSFCSSLLPETEVALGCLSGRPIFDRPGPLSMGPLQRNTQKYYLCKQQHCCRPPGYRH